MKDTIDILLFGGLGWLAVTIAGAHLTKGPVMEAEDSYQSHTDELEHSEPTRLPPLPDIPVVQPQHPQPTKQPKQPAPVAVDPPPLPSPETPPEPAKPKSRPKERVASERGEALWFSNLYDATLEHERTGEPIFIIFTIPTCSECKRFKALAETNREVAALLDRFVLVDVDCEAQPNVAAQFKVGNLMPEYRVYWPPNGDTYRVERGLSVPRFVQIVQSIERSFSGGKP